MKSTRLLPVAAAAVSFAASVHAAGPLPAVTDPAAPVAPLQYQSVFPQTTERGDNQPAPDTLWIKANRALTEEPAADPHAAHQAGHGSADAPAGAPAAAATPATPVEAKPAADAHHGHHMPRKER